MFAEVGAGYETNVAAAAIFPLLTKHVTCTTLWQLPVRIASPVPSCVYGVFGCHLHYIYHFLPTVL